MKRLRYSEEQVIGILKEHEAGGPVAELCRKHAMSSATFYPWKARLGGMEVSDAKRLKSLEEENARLKGLLADATLDKEVARFFRSASGLPPSGSSPWFRRRIGVGWVR